MDVNVNDHLDHQRWLLNHGLINDLHKDTLYMYGAIVHKNVQAVEVRIDVENKVVEYDVYIDTELEKVLKKYETLSKSNSIISLWRLKKLLTKEGNLNFMSMLSRFVTDYCRPKWSVRLQIRNFAQYEDGFKQQQDQDEHAILHGKPN